MVSVFYVAGVQRGGEHLIMNYIIAMFNNVIYKPDCKLSFKTGNYEFEYYVGGKLLKKLGTCDYSTINYKHDVVVLGAENMCIKNIPDIMDNEHISKNILVERAAVHDITNIFFIQVIRNPLNILASCIKMGIGRNNGFNQDQYVYMILQVFKNIIIEMESKGSADIHYLNYDKFLTYSGCRKEFIRYCKGTRPFNLVDRVLKNVRLSSFGKNSTSSFLNRHQEMSNNPRYEKLADQELAAISSRYF